MDMRWCVLALLSLVALAHADETGNLRPRAYSPKTLRSGFRPIAPSLAELAGYQQRQQPQEQDAYIVQRQQQYQEESQPARSTQQMQRDQHPQLQQEAEEELEESQEGPDSRERLLLQSKFDCTNKQSGYYADVELNCEVFHYCQDNVKYSWICPEGYSFHQVYMVCMLTATHDICQKSAKYHFVNEYLYKTINEEEVQRKPNVSLKYSERYYPAEVYRDDRYEGKDKSEGQKEAPRRHAPQPQELQARPSPRPQPAQVFRPAEEINIPLVQRRTQRPYKFDV